MITRSLRSLVILSRGESKEKACHASHDRSLMYLSPFRRCSQIPSGLLAHFVRS